MTRQNAPPSDTGDTRFRITLLGGFTITRAGRTLTEESWPLRKASSLVKVLALAPQHALHRERVCDLLWPDLPFDAAYNNLRYALHIARRTLAREVDDDTLLVLRQQHLTLRSTEPLWIDAEAFEAAAAAARTQRAPQAYEAAIAGYTGDLLPDDRYEDWAAVRRESLRATYQTTLTELAALYEERGEEPAAIATLHRVVALEPADEDAHTRLMRLYAQSGQRSQALRQYATLRTTLQREIDVAPAPETERLYTDVLAGRLMPDAHPRRDELPPPLLRAAHNLPAAMTRFIGRERERTEVAQLLAETRLLTLVGAGGSGKTRLALAIAQDCISAYPDGVWFVELASTTDSALVPQMVAAALALREEPGHTHTATLVDALRTRRLLLVLDNCEHLTDACATLGATLLIACPHLRILATSREALRLPGEVIWRVPSLTVPDVSAGPPAARLMESEAAQLFIDRVRWRQPAFALTAENADAVATICRQLDGMPLALELAAARASILTVPQLAARLNDTLRLLTDGGRIAPPRQRTLRATLDWSYALLDANERVMLRRLAVFAGGCTLEAAEAICAGDGIARDDVLPLMAQLADKSLTFVEAERGEARYRLLETVRQYAAEQLTASGEAESLRRRHAAHFLALAEAVQPTLADPVQSALLMRLDMEHDNLRAALHWARDSGAEATGLRLAAALRPFWNVRGHFDEGYTWLVSFLERTAESDSPDLLAIQAKARASAALLANQRGDIAAGAAHAEQGLIIYRRLDDRRGAAFVLNLLGVAAARNSDYEGSVGWYSESLALYRELGDTRGIATDLSNLGRSMRFMGNVARAAAFFQESETLRREIGDIHGLANVLGNQGHMAREQDDPAHAAPLLAESLALYERTGDKRGIGIALNQLAQLALDTGDSARAQSLCERSLALRREIGDRWGIANSLCTLGEIAASADVARAGALFRESLAAYGEMNNLLGIAECLERLAHLLADAGGTERAARFLGAANVIREQIGAPVFPIDHPLVESSAATARAMLGDTRFEAAWNTGRGLTVAQVVTEALRPA